MPDIPLFRKPLTYRIVSAGPRLRLLFFVDGEWRRNAALTENEEDSLARELRDSEQRRAA